MKAFYIETCEGVIRDNADFMTPTDFIKANRKASLDINFFPPKCILNEFGISEIELYDIVNDENENNRLFTNRELEFRKGKRFTMDDIFYAFSIEYDQLTIDISDYISWKNRHKEWCEEKKRIVKQIESELCGDSALETELAACREQLEEARREIPDKGEHETVHGEDFPAEYEGHGIFTMVAKLVDERAPVKDIMRLLANEKDFLSNKEEGYFFHPSPEGKAASTLRNYIKNRLKSV